MMKPLFSLNLLLAVASAFLSPAAIGCRHDPQPTVVTPPPDPEPMVQTTPPEPAPPTGQRTYHPTSLQWVRLPVRLEYPSGGARLSDEHRALLREGYASVVHRTDIVRIRVDGHADSRGNQQMNQQLAEERAQNVVDFLVGELGMPRELFEIRGHGSDAPISSGATASDRLLNRRVEFSIQVRRTAAD